MPDNSHCPLCDGEPEYFDKFTDSDAFNVKCRRCGRYEITWEALKVVKPEQKLRLSAFCRRAGRATPPPTIQSDNIEQLLSTLPVFGPLEKLDNLLLLLGERTSKLGENAPLDEQLDYPLLISYPEEITFLRENLWTEGFIQAGTNAGIRVTMKGWERIQHIQKSGRDSKRAFVAMWFDGS